MKKTSFILIPILVLLVMAACKKKETPLLPIKISSVEAQRIFKGDNCGSSARYYQFYTGNNVFRIKGENLRSVDIVETNDVNITVMDYGMQGEDLVIITTCDHYGEIQNPFHFKFTRFEDEGETEYKTPNMHVIGDINGFAYGSNMGNILNYMDAKKISYPDDFISDFEDISGYYEPLEDDIILSGGEYWIINEKPAITANAYQRKYLFTALRWDCKGESVEELFEFVTNVDKGIVSNPQNISKIYTP